MKCHNWKLPYCSNYENKYRFRPDNSNLRWELV